MSNKTKSGVDYASGTDKTAILCLSCYREDCDHIQRLRLVSEQLKRDDMVSGIIAEYNVTVVPMDAKHVGIELEPTLFTPSPDPIPPTAYHNVFPPVTSEGIQEAAKRLRGLRAQWDKEDAEILANLHAREPLQPRAPNLNPDDTRSCTIERYLEPQFVRHVDARFPTLNPDDSQDEPR